MRKKNHPILALIGVCCLISVLYAKGAFTPWSDDESDTTETSIETEADTNTGIKAEHIHAGLDPVEEDVVYATCTENGTYDKVVYCSCGKELSRETIDVSAAGHNYYVEQSVDATCLEQGYTVYTCSVCQNSYKGDYTEALGHDYVDGICHLCSVKDPDYTKVYTSKEIVTTLTENLVNESGTFKSYLNGETINVFAEDYSDCFSMNTAVSYNLWGHNVQSVAFNISKIASEIDTLYFNVAGETGTSGTINIEFFLDKTMDETPDYTTSIECSAIPTPMSVNIGGARSLVIRVTNCSTNENRVVFYDFSSEEPI